MFFVFPALVFAFYRFWFELSFAVILWFYDEWCLVPGAVDSF
jgi:hypothetical protein